MRRDQEDLEALSTGDQWTTLAGAVARIAAGYGLSHGAALKVLRQAGISGEVRARGFYLGKIRALGPGDWRSSQIAPESGALLGYSILGLLELPGISQITEVTANVPDLDWWLERRCWAQGENDTGVAECLPSPGIRTRTEQTAEEECLAWFAGLPPEPRITKAAAIEQAKRRFGRYLSDKAFSRVWHTEAGEKGWKKPGRPRTRRAPS
jgi:hypothetical protein